MLTYNVDKKPRLQYYSQNYYQVRCAEVLGGFLGFLSAVLVITLCATLIPSQCLINNEFVCNDNGSNGAGQCLTSIVCGVLYSGTSCVDNQIPGYLESTSQACYSKGFPTFTMTIDDVFDECSSSNGGWTGNGCAERIATAYNDTPSDPCCMLPCNPAIFYYKKGYNTPSLQSHFL